MTEFCENNADAQLCITQKKAITIKNGGCLLWRLQST